MLGINFWMEVVDGHLGRICSGMGNGMIMPSPQTRHEVRATLVLSIILFFFCQVVLFFIIAKILYKFRRASNS